MFSGARYTIRSLWRSPAYSTGAVLSLAVGIGASVAIFSFVDRILFRPLPYPAPDRLVSIGLIAPAADGNEFLPVSAFLRVRDRQTAFSGMGAFAFTSDCDLRRANPVRARCTRVDEGFLSVFGVAPAAGRLFHGSDRAAVLLSFPFWTSQFGADPAVVGQAIRIDEQLLTIVGVLPSEFELFNLSATDLLIPARLAEAGPGEVVRAFARLRPGVTVEDAQVRIQPILSEELSTLPAELRAGARPMVRSLHERQTWQVRGAAWMLLGAVLLVLLVACGNVAGLLAVRAWERRRDRAIRLALGASRSRLAGMWLSESLCLAFAGSAAGCAFAWALLRFFVWIAPAGILRLKQASIDLRIALFAAGAAVFTGVLLAASAALSGGDPGSLTGGRSIAGRRGAARSVFLAVQIAASLVLLSGAALLLRTLWRIEHEPLGFDPGDTLTARFVLGREYQGSALLQFYAGLESRLRRFPVPTAIASSIPPFGGVQATPFSALQVEGRSKLADGTGGAVAWRYVTPGYFAAMGIRIERGRPFTEEDRGPGGSAIVLSRTLARRLFGDADPVGRRLFPTRAGWHTVVGVAADVRNNGLEEPAMPEYYAVRKHSADELFGDGSRWRGATIVVRGRIGAAEIRAAIAELDPQVPVTFQTMRERVAEALAGRRFNGLLLTGFAACALLLAAVGIYGLVAFLISQRTREIGIRMAVGATPNLVARELIRAAARATAAGVAIGSAASVPAIRWLGSAPDFAGLAAGAGLLAAVALAAAYIPTRRIARVDPAESLRAE